MPSNRKMYHSFVWILISVQEEVYVIECNYCHVTSHSSNYGKLKKERCKIRERQERDLELMSYGY